MQHSFPSLPRRSARVLAVLGVATCALLGSAQAQVTTSKSALDALGAPKKHAAMLPDGGSMSLSGTTTPDMPESAASAPPAAQLPPKPTSRPRNSASSPPAATRHATTAPAPAPAPQPASPVAAPATAKAPASTHATAPAPMPSSSANTVAPAAAIAALPPVATRPPDNPVLHPPETPVTLHPFTPPPEVKPDPQARGRAEKVTGGTRLHFATQSADMNPRMMTALQTFATLMQKLPDQHINIVAYGEGRPDDPSTPRRVALSRGLAVRSVLIHAGVAPTRIYVRAIGLPDADAQGAGADCVDVTRSGVVASTTPTDPPAH
ncbi:OmpA family protein [Komagataeibacter xylinus]|uniref:OmpA family protein n=1 Tax=Komagataeibacter xylinus TaxID=28448 RepID=UPI00280ABE9C|nr:OmpA family protein [Komagataeibacter xylinus]